MESGITETGITESGITWKFDSGIGYYKKMESGITESGITESGITRKRNLLSHYSRLAAAPPFGRGAARKGGSAPF